MIDPSQILFTILNGESCPLEEQPPLVCKDTSSNLPELPNLSAH